MYNNHQARREPQQSPGKHSRGVPKHFPGPLYWEKFKKKFFQNGRSTFWRFLANGGAPKRRGAQGILPPYPIFPTGLITTLLQIVCRVCQWKHL